MMAQNSPLLELGCGAASLKCVRHAAAHQLLAQRLACVDQLRRRARCTLDDADALKVRGAQPMREAVRDTVDHAVLLHFGRKQSTQMPTSGGQGDRGSRSAWPRQERLCEDGQHVIRDVGDEVQLRIISHAARLNGDEYLANARARGDAQRRRLDGQADKPVASNRSRAAW